MTSAKRSRTSIEPSRASAGWRTMGKALPNGRIRLERDDRELGIVQDCLNEAMQLGGKPQRR